MMPYCLIEYSRHIGMLSQRYIDDSVISGVAFQVNPRYPPAALPDIYSSDWQLALKAYRQYRLISGPPVMPSPAINSYVRQLHVTDSI